MLADTFMSVQTTWAEDLWVFVDPFLAHPLGSTGGRTSPYLMKWITWLSVVARKPFIKLCSFYLYCQCPCSTSGPSPDYSSLVWARKFLAPSQGPQSFWSNQNSSIINTLSLPLTLILLTQGGWEGQKFWCLFTKGRSDSNDLSCRILAAKLTMFAAWYCGVVDSCFLRCKTSNFS